MAVGPLVGPRDGGVNIIAVEGVVGVGDGAGDRPGHARARPYASVPGVEQERPGAVGPIRPAIEIVFPGGATVQRRDAQIEVVGVGRWRGRQPWRLKSDRQGGVVARHAAIGVADHHPIVPCVAAQHGVQSERPGRRPGQIGPVVAQLELPLVAQRGLAGGRYAERDTGPFNHCLATGLGRDRGRHAIGHKRVVGSDVFLIVVVAVEILVGTRVEGRSAKPLDGPEVGNANGVGPDANVRPAAVGGAIGKERRHTAHCAIGQGQTDIGEAQPRLAQLKRNVGQSQVEFAIGPNGSLGPAQLQVAQRLGLPVGAQEVNRGGGEIGRPTGIVADIGAKSAIILGRQDRRIVGWRGTHHRARQIQRRAIIIFEYTIS